MSSDQAIEIDRAGTIYECASCDDVVQPDEDTEGALIIGGLQRRICRDCGREMLEGFINA